MERDALIRARRRRQALEAIEDERNRALALVEVLETVSAELGGADVDAPVFAQLTEAELAIVRDTLGLSEDKPVADEEEDIFAGFTDEPDETPAERTARLEEEIARLEEEIAATYERQAAITRYVGLLDATVSASTV